MAGSRDRQPRAAHMTSQDSLVSPYSRRDATQMLGQPGCLALPG